MERPVTSPSAERPAGTAGATRVPLRTRMLRRTWSRRAEAWDESVIPGLEKIAASVLDNAGPVGGLRVVDLGCGSGRLSLPLAEKGATVTAVDFSADMLRLLRRRAEGQGLTNIHTVLAPLQALDLPSGSTDVIVTNYALHHLRHPEKVDLLGRAACWLRPGGRLVVGDMMFAIGGGAADRRIIRSKVAAIARRGPAGWWRIAKNTWRLYVARQECPASMEAWQRMLRDAGFVGVTAERVVAEAAVVSGARPTSGNRSDPGRRHRTGAPDDTEM